MRDVFSWAFPIGQLFGITIRVHLILPLVMIGLIGREAARKDTIPGSWEDACWLMAILFVSVLLHEIGHCIAARYMDGEADEVLLWPLGGLAFCRSLPHTPLAHFVFALGGPLVNLAICVVAGLALSFAFDHSFQPQFNPIWNPYRVNDEGGIRFDVWAGAALDRPVTNLLAVNLQRLFWLNWVLFLFNVVMAGIPFDGGRMLEAALWPRLGSFQAKRVSIYAGFIIMILIGLASIVWSEPLLIMLAIFVAISCAQELMSLEQAQEESLFGYDFSQGYTSLEKDEPPPPAPPKRKKQNFIQRWIAERAAKKRQQAREEREADDRRMDQLLEKIQRHGKHSLTDEENRFLKRVADRYKNKP